MPKDYLNSGKYEEYSALKMLECNQTQVGFMYTLLGQPNKALDYAMKYLEWADQAKKIEPDVYGDNGEKMSAILFGTQEHRNFINEAKQVADETIKKIEQDKKDNKPNHLLPYLGLFKIVSSSLDTKKGNFTEMYVDSPVIEKLLGMLTNTFKTNEALNGDVEHDSKVLLEWQEALSDQVDEETKEKVPFSYIVKFYDHLAELHELELEKQRIRDEYSVEKEKEYLNRLSIAYTKFTDNMTRFTRFVKGKYVDQKDGTSKDVVNKQDGTTKYDSLFQNGLDMFTGTVQVGAFNARSTSIPQAWIRGMNQAIQNGWGMNELEVLGCVEATVTCLEDELNSYKLKNKMPDDKEDDVAINMRAQIQAVKTYKETVWNRKVHTKEEKLKIAEEVKNLLDKVIASEVPSADTITKNLKSQIEAFILRTVAKNRIKKLPSKEEKDEMFSATFKKRQESAFILDEAKTLKDSVIKENNPSLFNEIYEDDQSKKKGNHTRFYDYKKEQIQTGYAPSKSGLGKGTLEVTVERYAGTDEDAQIMTDWVNRTHAWYGDYLKTLPKADMVFYPVYNITKTILNTKKGSYLDACLDNQILTIAKRHSNFMPKIFKEWKGVGNSAADREAVRKGLKKSGVLLPVVAYYDGLNDVINAEYLKQQLQKKGWTTEAEKEYYKKISFAYGKVIKAYEELAAFPDEIQAESKKNLEDNLGAITDQNDKLRRGISAAVEGMKWELQGIKNGWHAEHIAVMRNLGLIEGHFKREIAIEERELKMKKERLEGYKAANDQDMISKVEGDIKNTEKKLANYRNFRDKELAEFKKTVWNKKINGADDVLDVLNMFDRFRWDNMDKEDVSNELKIKYNEMRLILNDINNKAISEQMAIYEKKAVWRKPVEMENPYSALEKDQEVLLEHMRNQKHFDANEMIAMTTQYMLLGLEKSGSEAMKNPKHAPYVTHAVKKYANEFVESLMQSIQKSRKDRVSGKLFAEYMKHGHHENYYSLIEESAASQEKKSRLVYFIEGKSGTNEKGQRITGEEMVALAMGDIAQADVMDALAQFSGTKYGEFKNKLGLLLSDKNYYNKLLLEKIEKKEDAVLPAGTLRGYHKRVKDLYKDADSLIKGIQKTDKGLTELDKLMIDALEKSKKGLLALEKGIKVFMNDGPTKRDFQLLQGYGVKYHDVTSYVHCVKNRNAELLGEAQLKAFEQIEIEKSRFTKSLQPYNEQAVLNSAMNMIYLDSLFVAYSRQTSDLSLERRYVTEFMSCVKAFNEKKGESAESIAFRKSAFENNEFKEAFKVAVLSKVNAGYVKPDEIYQCRDEAMRQVQSDLIKQIRENKGNPEMVKDAKTKLEGLDNLAARIGSTVDSRNLIEEQKRNSVKKAIEMVGDKIKNNSMHN